MCIRDRNYIDEKNIGLFQKNRVCRREKGLHPSWVYGIVYCVCVRDRSSAATV